MVGHFLHPNRRSRSSTNSNGSNSSSNSVGSSSHSPHMPVSSPAHPSAAAAIGASLAYNPHNNAIPSRHHAMPSQQEGPIIPYMPPQNLTAEAVAALPPPGESSFFVSVSASGSAFR